jgi:hypothetical protein
MKIKDWVIFREKDHPRDGESAIVVWMGGYDVGVRFTTDSHEMAVGGGKLTVVDNPHA